MESHVFRFALAALATWRVAFLLAREEGPWGACAALRAYLRNRGITRAFECVKCLSVWIAAPLAFFVGGSAIELAVMWLALSGAAALADEWLKPPFEFEEGRSDELLREEVDRRSE